MNSNIKIFDTKKEINDKKLSLIIPKNDYENYLNIKNITFHIQITKMFSKI